MDERSQGRPGHAGPASPEPSSATSEKHPAPPGGPPGSQDAADFQLNKRRRGLGVVTPNACTECRKKRAKCDGQNPCGRCKAQKDIECVYEVPVRQSKENLRTEIEHLRKQQRQSDSVFGALARAELWEDTLAKLRDGQTVETIADWLGGSSVRSGLSRKPPAGPTLPLSGMGYAGTTTLPGGYGTMTVPAMGHKQEYDQNSPWAFSSQSQAHSTRSSSHPDLMQWTADVPPQNRVGSWVQSQSSTSEGSLRYRGLDQVLNPLDSPDGKVPPVAWTSVTGDVHLVKHLLALYFCWEYPTFSSFSKEHFVQDFQEGRNRYCSPILVNALLALGCRFSTQPATRADPDDPYTSGDHFFKETLRLLYRENNHHTLTTVQALGIMSIREASCGRDSESWYYAGQSARMAIEMGLHRLEDHGDQDEVAVQAATFWGAFALDHAWSLATGSLPQCSCYPHLPPKPAIIDQIETSSWMPYTDDGAPLQRSCEQPSNVRSVYKCFCELSELVHQSLYILHSPGKPVTSRDLLNIYTQYLNWYDRIPVVLRLGRNFTPAVLFAHMYYHFAILLLFRPLIRLRIIGSSIIPRDVCAQAADAIQGLLRSYAQLYTLRRTPSFVPYFVLTSAIMHLAVGAQTPSPEITSPPSSSNPPAAKVDDTKPSHAHPPRTASSSATAEGSSPNSATTAKLSARAAEAINQGIADLTEMAPCHHFAEQALHILRYLAKKWNIPIEVPPPEKSLLEEEAAQLVKPHTSSLNFFKPNVMEDDFLCAWGTHGQPSGPDHRLPGPGAVAAPQSEPPNPNVQKATEIPDSPQLDSSGLAQGIRMEVELGAGPMAHTAKSVENPLFWPFPMQGRPMIPSGRMLQEAGFAILR
ncbi:fungal-specific transcription factor domain-containing protein [Xylariales sp. AK1849]|nr:fungal-specific transcription factor domain-containing protein [Xylariales sp. AK1849]